MSDQGGLEQCGAYGCPFHGAISVEGGRWFCQHHARRVSGQFDTVTQVLNANLTLVREIQRGYKVITQDLPQAAIKDVAFEQATALVSMKYEVPLNLIDEDPGEDKCWNLDYRAFIRGCESILNAKVQQALTKSREPA